MKNVFGLSVICLFVFCFGVQVSLAQGPDLAALDIGAIKSLQVNEEESGYYSNVEVLIQNKGDKPLKLKNTNFEVKFRENKEVLPLGIARIDELIVPPNTGDASGVGEIAVQLNVKIGPKDNKTMGRLIHLFNIVGNPSNSLIMILEGTGEFGAKVENGWIYQTGMKAELEFVPTIQREILFK